MLSGFLIMGLLTVQNVWAATVTLKRADAYAFKCYRNGTYHTTESRLKLGDQNVWCIEPSISVGPDGQNFTVKNAQGSAWLKNKYEWSQSKCNNVSKAIWFARKYASEKGFDTSLTYVLIQNVLWSRIQTGDNKGWYVLTNGTKEYTQLNSREKVSKLVEAMYDKVEDYNKKPSWNGKTVTVNVGKAVTLSDTQKVSNDIEIVGDLPEGLAISKKESGISIYASSNMAGKTVTVPYVKKQIPETSFGSGDQINVFTKTGRQTMSYWGKPMGVVKGTLKVTIPMPKVSVSGKKVWQDNGNAYKTRPANYQMRLLRNGSQIKTASFASNGGWEFKDLNKYDSNGKAYQYTVTESKITLNNGDYYKPSSSGTTWTNTLNGTISVSVQKEWNDQNNAEKIRPKSVAVVLQSVSGGSVKEIKTITLNEDNQWKSSVGGLEKYQNGKKISYRFIEKSVPEGYEAEVSVSGSHTVIRNRHSVGKKITLYKRMQAEEVLRYLDYLEHRGKTQFPVCMHLAYTEDDGSKVVFTKTICVDRNTVLSHTDTDGYVQFSVVFDELAEKTYLAYESEVANFRQTDNLKAQNGTIQGNRIQFPMEKADLASGSFENRYEWNQTETDFAVNHIRLSSE